MPRRLLYDTVVVSASVKETVTGVNLGGNSTVSCNANRYNLTFLDITPTSFKPRMLFYGYVSTFSLFLLVPCRPFERMNLRGRRRSSTSASSKFREVDLDV